MQNEINLPNPGLTSTDITRLLYFTLVGASHNGIHAVGQAEILVNHLNNLGLGDTKLSPKHFIALQSMLFNAGSRIIGPRLADALKIISQGGDDLPALEQILEYSNVEKSVGIENRRLQEAGLFHGDPSPDGIHLYWRVYHRYFPNAKVLSVKQQPPLYPLPSGIQHKNYAGGETVQTVKGPDAQGLDITVFGSDKNDAVSGTTGAVVLLGGNGDDTLSLPSGMGSHYAYLAGNDGFDSYRIDSLLESNRSRIVVYDSDRQGKLVYQNTAIEGLIIDGSLTCNGITISNIQRTANADGSYWLTMQAVSIPNYVSGQFGLFWANRTRMLEADMWTYPYANSAFGILNDGTMMYCVTPPYDFNTVYTRIYTANNVLIKEYNTSLGFDVDYFEGIIPKTGGLYLTRMVPPDSLQMVLNGKPLITCKEAWRGIDTIIHDDFTRSFVCNTSQLTGNLNGNYEISLPFGDDYTLFLKQTTSPDPNLLKGTLTISVINSNKQVVGTYQPNVIYPYLDPSVVLANGNAAILYELHNYPTSTNWSVEYLAIESPQKIPQLSSETSEIPFKPSSQNFHTTTPEPPCAYPGKGTNLHASSNHENSRALLPACQLTPDTLREKAMTGFTVAGITAIATEIPCEFLERRYPKQTAAQVVRASLRFAPTAALAYANNSLQMPAITSAMLLLVTALRLMGVSERSAQMTAWLMTTALSVWLTSPADCNAALEQVGLFAAGVIGDYVGRKAVRSTAQVMFGHQ